MRYDVSTKAGKQLWLAVALACGSLAIGLFTRGQAFAADPIVRWDFHSGSSGWRGNDQCRLSLLDDHLVVEGTGDDPAMTADASAPAGWVELTIRVKVAARYDAQLFWAGKDDASFAEERSVKFSLRGSATEARDIRVYFQTKTPLARLRLDPHNGKCRLEIAALSLARREPSQGSATPADEVHVLPGFHVELLYTVPRETQGSWVNLCTEKQGRLIASDQSGKLYRVTPSPIGNSAEPKVEPLPVDIGMAQGLLYAFDSLYVMVNDYGNKKSGLYRVRDTNGDDQYDSVEQLRKIDGGGEHGPHALVLAPDGKSLYFACGNHTNAPTFEKSLLPRNWQEDQLLPRMWDAGGHAVGRLAPGGFICRTDPDGKELELVSSGYRNQYDLALNRDGELFTFDADMEWDIGAPWYRPTRVNHAVSGSEFGWRSGTGKWPDYYPDSLGSVIDIGPGSPTGIAFGTGAKFPAKYQQALLLCDWSYGKIYAVHLEPDGATYKGTAEQFAAAAPFPVTDLVVNPSDGALYITIGGRGTQSGLYRITYTGSEPTAPAASAPDGMEQARTLRRQLESLHGRQDPATVEKAWPYLSHADRSIRYAARIAIEHQPVETWQQRALDEKNAVALITAIVALARNGKPELEWQMVDKLSRLDWNRLDPDRKLDLLRAYGLTFARLGQPSDDARDIALRALDSRYPSGNARLNRELCALLVYLRAPNVVGRTIDLLAKASTQEEHVHYLFCLRVAKDGWSMEQRSKYFAAFSKSFSAHRGGHSFAGFLKNIRGEAIESLSEEMKRELAEVLKEQPAPDATTAAPPRPVVKKWTVDELLSVTDMQLQGRNFDRGRQIFADANCFKCHRIAGEGGITGPDLTGVSGRFNNRNLLEALIEPSKVISDQYQTTQFVLANGRTIVGRIVNLNNNVYSVMTDMLNPGKQEQIARDSIEEVSPSQVSLMPDGLLDTFNEQEILDLLAFLRSGGNSGHELFKAAGK